MDICLCICYRFVKYTFDHVMILSRAFLHELTKIFVLQWIILDKSNMSFSPTFQHLIFAHSPVCNYRKAVFFLDGSNIVCLTSWIEIHFNSWNLRILLDFLNVECMSTSFGLCLMRIYIQIFPSFLPNSLKWLSMNIWRSSFQKIISYRIPNYLRTRKGNA